MTDCVSKEMSSVPTDDSVALRSTHVHTSAPKHTHTHAHNLKSRKSGWKSHGGRKYQPGPLARVGCGNCSLVDSGLWSQKV